MLSTIRRPDFGDAFGEVVRFRAGRDDDFGGRLRCPSSGDDSGTAGDFWGGTEVSGGISDVGVGVVVGVEMCGESFAERKVFLGVGGAAVRGFDVAERRGGIGRVMGDETAVRGQE